MIADIPTGLWVIFVAAGVSWYSTLNYARLTWRGELNPSLTSWSVWTATTALGTGSAFALGSTVGAVVSGATCLRCAQVLFPALVRRGIIALKVHWKVPGVVATTLPVHSRTQRFIDLFCLIACVLIAVGWLVTDDPMLALIFSILIDFVACLPTIYHGWQRQEHPKPFWLGMLGPAIALLLVPERVVSNYAWPLYELGANILMVLPPMLRGWPVGDLEKQKIFLPSWRQRMGTSVGVGMLYTAAVLLIFVVVPLPTSADVVSPPLRAVQTVPAQLSFPIAPPDFPLVISGMASCAHPHVVALSPDDQLLAVVCFDSDYLFLVDRKSGVWQVSTAVEVGRSPQSVVWTSDGRRLLTADNMSNTVSVVDVLSQRRVAQLTGFLSPVSITMSDSGDALVTCFGADPVKKIAASALSNY